MVRKFTRPPKAPGPASESAVAPIADWNAQPTIVNAQPTMKMHATKKRSSPKSAQSSTSTIISFADYEATTTKRARQPHRPYQAPEPIPYKILQLIKSEDKKLLNQNRQNQAANAKSKLAKKRPAAPEAPTSSVPSKRKKLKLKIILPRPEVQSKKLATPAAVKKSSSISKPATVKKSPSISKPASPKPSSNASTSIATTAGTTNSKKSTTSTSKAKVLVKRARTSVNPNPKAPSILAGRKKKPKTKNQNQRLNGGREISTPIVPAKSKIKRKRKKQGDLETKQAELPLPSHIPEARPGISPKIKERPQNLTPRQSVTHYEKDPTFESVIPIPFISTVAQSKLLIRATRMGNVKLLEKLISNKKEITSFCVPQSLNVDRDAAFYAVENEQMDALKLLMNAKLTENLGPFPDSMVEDESTGRGSVMMFGHGIRAVTVARGGKEGNNALTKDTIRQQISGIPNHYTLIRQCMQLGKPISVLTKVIGIEGSDNESHCWDYALSNISEALLHGQNKIAGELVAEAIKRGGYGFNELHKQALILSNKEQFSPFKSVSVIKKATGNARVTPIHLASINPDETYLTTLLNSKPDFSSLDSVQRTPMHYAAVCSGTGPLAYLLSKGISAQILDKEGKSPIYLAAEMGRAANVALILRAQPGSSTGNEDGGPPKDISGAFIDRPRKSNGLSPIHIAAQNGHKDVVKTLLYLGADAEKYTPAQNDKLTPLMIAAQFGHLEVVKLLIEKGRVKVDAKDKRGRTALTHAVIDGNAQIVSYLLRLGADNKVKDTSGNTLVHYASAYGWYFNWKLLLESGCTPNDPNDWKMTPVAIAFMKGHMGLVELALSQPKGDEGTGVDINAPVNYASGTTLLHQTCSARPGESLVPRLKYLVETHCANVNVLDYEKNNALHYLARSEGNEVIRRASRNWMTDEAKEELAKENKKTQEYLFMGVKLLLHHNCDPLKLNMKNETPVSVASSRGCFVLLQVLLTSGKCDSLSPSAAAAVEIIADDKDISEDKTKNSSCTTILHNIVEHIRKDTVTEFYKYCMTQPKLVTELKLMARKTNTDGYSPLLLFLHNLSTIVSPSEDESENESSLEAKILDFLNFLVNTLDSDVNQIVRNKTISSALHIIAAQTTSCKYVDKILGILLLKKPNPDPLNGDLKTPLMLAVSSLNEDVARVLLKAGASPNFETTGEDGKSILILAAENAKASFNLIPLLVESGANVRDLSPKTGNSVLHIVASSPGKSGAIEAIRKIIATGRIDIIGVNKSGRTALHLSVNARGGETDVSYDVEDLLIEVGPKALATADFRGKFPLHYALVKIGKHKDSSQIDPIELVAILVRAMKDSNAGSRIFAQDEFGETVLHYAAQRGATISSSLLIGEARGEKAKINPVDSNGNTPYGLAVLKGHEGCALYFQQSGGDFVYSLNSRFKTEIGKNYTNSWKWRHSLLLEEYNERKLQEQSKYSILQEVVRKDWQGLLHLMLEKLKNSGAGVTPAIEVAVKTNRLKLALKLINRVKNNRELILAREQHSLLHTLAKSTETLQLELSSELVQKLVLKGISVGMLDSFKATPLIYAAQNRNSDLCTEFGKYMKIADIAKLPADKFGRTPFAAIFWNINSENNLPSGLMTWAAELLDNGAEANVLCHYPIALSPFPVTRSLAIQESAYSCKLSPLILAVVQGNYSIVKWLLGLNKSGKVYVNPNFPDEKGRTPLIHAARLNDIKMVKLLLNFRTYDVDKDKKPWNSKGKVGKVATPDPSVDLTIQDSSGWSVIHHLVAPLHPSHIFYFNSDAILRLLSSVGTPLEAKSIIKQTPLNLARLLNVYKLATVLQTLLGIHDYSTNSNDELDNSFTATEIEASTKEMVPQTGKIDFASQAAKMAEKLVAEHEKLNLDETDEASIEPDSLSGLNKNNSEVVFDATLNTPYDCLLTQVDLAYGIYGLYNFYKMQVIKEKHGKEMIILFTRWGRVGDTGQYQKTPFPTAEEATREFRKIFRAKSGNSWEDVNKFVPVPKRYRLVNTERRPLKKAKKNPVKVDFMELEMMAICTRSKIPSSIFELIKILSLVHRSSSKLNYSEENDSSDILPFGSMNSLILNQGDKILDEISKLIITRDVLRKKTSSGNIDNPQDSELINSIIEKSEEFYGLIPVYGFQFEKLSPLFSWNLLRPKQEKIHSLVHLGLATQLLLAAQLSQKEENPLDKIYKSLETEIELIDEFSHEAQLILQYIEETSKGRRRSELAIVKGIYEVQRPGEGEQMKNVGIGNKWLLWHGTKSKNILSILHSGLQMVPLGAELCGQMFGKGIYFADTFEKSRHYCSSDSSEYPQKFMFLCEVALGNVQNVDFDDITDEQSTLKSSFDSLKTCNARMIPDPGAVVYWKGAIVPLGKRIENIPEKEDDYFSIENNEYIIFNTNQVQLRYMIQFE